MIVIPLQACKLIVTAVCLMLLHTAHAAPPKCLVPGVLVVNRVADLQFGTFIGGSAGSITVPLAGGRTTSGVILAGGAVSPATFNVSTTEKSCENQFITVTGIPAGLTLLSPGLTVTAITSTLANNSSFKLSNFNNALEFFIGGTLNTDGTPPGGTYSVDFNVSFTFD